jgi:hypothetical protein
LREPLQEVRGAYLQHIADALAGQDGPPGDGAVYRAAKAAAASVLRGTTAI